MTLNHRRRIKPAKIVTYVVLIVIPVLVVYVLLQKHIIKGLTAGAVKG